jgi:hypothetical protein
LLPLGILATDGQAHPMAWEVPFSIKTYPLNFFVISCRANTAIAEKEN